MSHQPSGKHKILQYAIDAITLTYGPLIQKILQKYYTTAWEEKLRQIHMHHRIDVDDDDEQETPLDAKKRLQNSPEHLLKDPIVVLNVTIRLYSELFRAHPQKYFEQAKLGYFHEMRSARHNWAHRLPLSSMDLLRHLDTASRLLDSVPGAKEHFRKVEGFKQDLLIKFGKHLQEQRDRKKGEGSAQVQSEASHHTHDAQGLAVVSHGAPAGNAPPETSYYRRDEHSAGSHAHHAPSTQHTPSYSAPHITAPPQQHNTPPSYSHNTSYTTPSYTSDHSSTYSQGNTSYSSSNTSFSSNNISYSSSTFRESSPDPALEQLPTAPILQPPIKAVQERTMRRIAREEDAMDIG